MVRKSETAENFWMVVARTSEGKYCKALKQQHLNSKVGNKSKNYCMLHFECVVHLMKQLLLPFSVFLANHVPHPGAVFTINNFKPIFQHQISDIRL